MKKKLILVIAAIFFVLIFFVSIMSTAAWWNSDWNHRKEISISHTNTSGATLTNYPAFINVSKEPSMQSDFDDIRFIDNSGNLMYFELENYTASYGLYWVNITSLPNSGQTIWLYYGNDTVSSATDLTAVWDSNTKMVQHLNNMNDSTSYDNDAVNNNADYNASGKIDGAYDFDGSTSYLNCGNDTSLNITDVITIEAWVFLKSSTTGDYQVVAGRGYDDQTLALQNWLQFLSDEARPEICFKDGSGEHCLTSPDGISLNAWHHLVGTKDTTALKIYVDGVEKNSGAGGTSNSSTAQFTIGRWTKDADKNPLDGAIDEVRISSTARSADWINQSYQLATNQSGFVAWGSEQIGNDSSILSVTFNLVHSVIASSDALTVTFNLIKDFVAPVTDTLTVTFTLIKEIIAPVTDTLTVSFTLIQDFVAPVTDSLSVTFTLIQSGVITTTDSLNVSFTLLAEGITSVTDSVSVSFTLLAEGVSSVTDSINVSFTLLAESIVSAFDSLAVSLTLVKTIAPGTNCTVETLPVINHGTNNATLRGNLIDLNTSSATVWFEYGRGSGCYLYRTPNQTMNTTGVFTADIEGIWLIPEQTYHYRACVACSPAYYGDEMNFTLSPLEREIEDRNFSDEYKEIEGDELNMTKLAEAIPTVFTGLMGDVFFAILFGAIFLSYWIRQEDVTLPSLLGMVIGGSMLFLLPPSFKHMSYILLIISLAGIMYGILKSRR